MSKTNNLKIITSALPYVNNLPHLGNVVGCVLSSDVYYRFCKMNNERCIHICGTDEFGTATEIKAIESQLTPAELCDINSKKHKEVYDWFEIEFSHFGRTSKSRFHEEVVQDIFQRCFENGYFEEKMDTQFFCSSCKLFLADRYVKGVCNECGSDKARGDQCDDCGNLVRGTELKNPLCAICDKTPVLENTKHLYLKLEMLHEQIKEFYKSNGENWTNNAKKITEQWLAMDLHSRCMTRDLKYRWGIKVPMVGYESKVFYVWFDAPIGYFSFIKEHIPDEYEEVIRSPNTKLVQFMGKDNVPFHSIIFPGILMGTRDNYHLVNMISSTEYLMFENTKFSKSRNIGIFGNELTDNNFGPPCYLRYYLIKIRPEEKDSNFSCSDYITTVKADLINKLGNFIHRVLNFVKNKMSCQLNYTLRSGDEALINTINSLNNEYIEKMNNFRMREAVKVIMDTCEVGNKFVQDVFNNKDSSECKDGVFSIAVSIIRHLAYLIYPIMPTSSKKLHSMLNNEEIYFKGHFELLNSGHRISEDIEILFKPFTAQQEEYILKRQVNKD